MNFIFSLKKLGIFLRIKKLKASFFLLKHFMVKLIFYTALFYGQLSRIYLGLDLLL